MKATAAGLSGQLVMATIHARSVAMAVDTLNNMDVPHYVIGGALRLIIQQTSVLRLCKQCAQEITLNEEGRSLFASHQVPVPSAVYEALGCEACKGYWPSVRHPVNWCHTYTNASMTPI